jgi:hypothetical protein
MEHTIRRSSNNWFICSCHTFAVLGSDAAIANRLHAEHLTKAAASPTPAHITFHAQALAGVLRKPKSNVRR